jgi:hypothetical protein
VGTLLLATCLTAKQVPLVLTKRQLAAQQRCQNGEELTRERRCNADKCQRRPACPNCTLHADETPSRPLLGHRLSPCFVVEPEEAEPIPVGL